MNDGWMRCTEECYPTDETLKDGGVIVIAYKMEGEEKNPWCYWTYTDCPYGWSTLVRSVAYWRVLRQPDE